jgi:D-cysteine desulfhydrase
MLEKPHAHCAYIALYSTYGHAGAARPHGRYASGSTLCRLITPEPAMDLSRFPRRRYTNFATPLEPMPRFSAALAATCPGGVGPQVWIKRDDMLGLFPGGNKTRKLEFLMADALAQGADTLVTCGAPQSNHCRITLAAAVKEGLKCRFVIEERVPGSYSEKAGGNNFMFHLLGVEAITVVPGGSNMVQAMNEVAQALIQQGRKPYIVPGGGSNALGGLGYVACAQELQQQFFEQGVQIDHVIVGSGSSGTHGGLLAGFLGNHINIPITGIGVSRDPADQEPLVHKEAQAVMDLLGVNVTVPREAVVSVGGFWQPKYSVPNARMVEAVQMLARTEGIALDPVYTGKIMAGLIGLARKGAFKPNEKVLFMHTGGLPSLHVYEEVLLGDSAALAP